MVLQIVARSCASNIGRNCSKSTVINLNLKRSFHFSNTVRQQQQQQQQQQQKPLFGNREIKPIVQRRKLTKIFITIGRLVDSWNNTETKWYPIPVALGLSVIGFIQYRRVRQREDANLERPKYVATGPWQVIEIVYSCI
jgi:hypothetical protein